MTDFIRVRFKDSGTEQSIPRPVTLDNDAYTVLKEDGADRNGRPYAPKIPANTKSGQKAATEKESN